MNIKIYSIISSILFISVFFFGCIEDSQFNIKYASIENFIPKEKQGTMIFNFTIRSNEETETARLWIPYPVSNSNQKITNYSINKLLVFNDFYH